jgi:hypothetical protein
MQRLERRSIFESGAMMPPGGLHEAAQGSACHRLILQIHSANATMPLYAVRAYQAELDAPCRFDAADA